MRNGCSHYYNDSDQEYFDPRRFGVNLTDTVEAKHRPLWLSYLQRLKLTYDFKPLDLVCVFRRILASRNASNIKLLWINFAQNKSKVRRTSSFSAIKLLIENQESCWSQSQCQNHWRFIARNRTENCTFLLANMI